MNKLATLTAVATLAASLVFTAQTFAGEALEIDSFQCYNARIAKGEMPFNHRVVLLTNPFSDPEKPKNSVRNIAFVCAPVDKDGQGIINSESRMVCYTIKPKHTLDVMVLVTNQFGEQRLRVKNSKLLCIPSTVQVLGKRKK